MRLATASLLFLVPMSACTINGTFRAAPGAPVAVTAPDAPGACSSACDVATGCRVVVHRMYNDGSGEHFYTTTAGEGVSNGFHQEGGDYFQLATSPAPGLTPLHRCLMAYGKHFYTTAANCENSPGTEEGTLGYMSTTQTCGAVALYRSYNPGSNDHFYTVDASEHARATQGGGYRDEGIVGYVWGVPPT